MLIWYCFEKSKISNFEGFKVVKSLLTIIFLAVPFFAFGQDGGTVAAKCYATMSWAVANDSSASPDLKRRGDAWQLRLDEAAVPKFISRENFRREMLKEMKNISSKKDNGAYARKAFIECINIFGQI